VIWCWSKKKREEGEKKEVNHSRTSKKKLDVTYVTDEISKMVERGPSGGEGGRKKSCLRQKSIAGSDD